MRLEVGHTEWLAAEGVRLLDFARASRHPAGGFAWLDEVGRPELDRPVELWITCRMTHVFAIAHLMAVPGAGQLADHGVVALRGLFRDAAHGGWYAAVGPEGPTVRSKTAYEHAFVVLAAASATAAGRVGGRELLDEALSVLLGHFWDEAEGMVVEEWDEAFTTLDGYRGVNANMHTVEALLSAADVLDDPGLRDRAERIITRVVHGFAAGNRWRIPEHFDDTWTALPAYNRDEPAHAFRPYGATIGHWFEWSRLTLALRAARGEAAPAWMLDDARALFDAAVREGWAVDGADGFVYTVDWDGTPVVRQRMHWVAAEAIAAAAALADATGEPAYVDLYVRWWRHVVERFVDVEHGSWRHELSPTNAPGNVSGDVPGNVSGNVSGDLTWRGKPDVYHAFQATLLPRLPLTPTLARAVADGGLET